jgi:hypothetical protein
MKAHQLTLELNAIVICPYQLPPHVVIPAPIDVGMIFGIKGGVEGGTILCFAVGENFVELVHGVCDWLIRHFCRFGNSSLIS